MDKIRLSLGSAGVLGLKEIKSKAKTKTIFLMNSGGCVFNCSFCAQASQSSSREDKLSRISWPEFEVSEVLRALKNNQDRYSRICLQTVNTKNIFQELPGFVKKIKEAIGDKKIALSVRTQKIEDIDILFESGAHEIGLSIDAIDEKAFLEIKGGSLKIYKDIVLHVANKYPGQIATHLIIGMGEGERQAVKIMQELNSHQVIIALFAFTPVKGSKLESNKPPEMESYRRIQIALHLIRNNLVREFEYNKDAEIVNFGYNKAELLEILKDSDVFETSGCSDCNRPYYNERAGVEDLYNYPYKLKKGELETIINNIF